MKSYRSWIIAVVSLGFCLLTAVGVRAQESERRVKMRDLPEAVRKTVREQSKGASLRGLSEEVEGGKTFYEAELRVGGHNRDVLMDASGAVVEVEEEVALSSLPLTVKEQIKKQAGRGRILVVESITKNNAVVAYEAHVRKGGKSLEIKIAPDGTLISDEKEKD
jgi:hypothetical protein